MPYVATDPVIFPYSREQVFAELSDLSKMPLWNSGMLGISTPEDHMREGLHYTTQSAVAGKMSTSEIDVVRVVPNELIELVNDAGLVSFRASFIFKDVSLDSTEVVVTLKFDLRNFVLNLARPVMENMAQARMQGDLEALRASMAGN